MIVRLLIFLAINLGALGLGSLFTSKGVSSEWYQALTKAPWTPPGWTFGAAWVTIMICFSIYMAYGWNMIGNKNLLVILFLVQLLLNVAWNPVFFYYHLPLAGFLIILLLTLLIAFFFFFYWPVLKTISLFLLPYLIWLVIASSLNGYILLKN